MRDLKNNLTPGKNSRNIQSKKTKSFGYQVLGFGAGGDVGTFIVATGGTPCAGQISGDYKYHTFNGPGTFCVSAVGCESGSNTVSYMVVAGGAGSGTPQGGGAGGAGGYREGKASSDCYTASPLNAPAGLPVSVQGYPITVGGGGAFTVNGSNSIFSTITSTGGGKGGNGGAGTTGTAGGSGGGAGGRNGNAGGTGNTNCYSPAEGFDGGTSSPASGPTSSDTGGGGGGALVAGGNGSPNGPGGAGGGGATSCITASPTARAGGGGGGSQIGSGGAAGSGGGGSGGGGASGSGGGTVNTGGGGGGTGTGPCGNSGGSGVVVVRYKFQ
jgi:hypothetical protein